MSLPLSTQLQDSAALAARRMAEAIGNDSIPVKAPPPLPGGPAAMVRFLMNTVPQWVQIGGVVIGAIVSIVALVLIVRHWRDILAWFAAKSNAWKAAFAGVLVVAAGMGVWAGLASWKFMMHDNRFCSGCHVMNTPFQKFASTQSKHAELLCHDCHQQPIWASMKELYVWVGWRPEKIPSHANSVPNKVCAGCHVQRDPDSTWKRVVATAGHQVHLNSSSPLGKRLDCVTCHAPEVHTFKTAQKTCGQVGCHDKIKIQLGKMADQSDLHCATCHKFTVAALEVNPIDSARAGMTPKQKECFSCHQMKTRFGKTDPSSDPHKGGCGTCHNPHTQTTQFGAFQSCATSQCHAKSDTLTAMHRGLGNHELENCGACHVAHTWKAIAKDCRSCHTLIDQDKTRPPRARRRVSELPLEFRDDGGGREGVPRWVGAESGPRVVAAKRNAQSPSKVAADTATFSHRRHRTVQCTTCHNMSDQHGPLIISRSDCQACHHSNKPAYENCERCHARPELTAVTTQTVAVHVAGRAEAKSRTLAFAHSRHPGLACATCHGTDVTRRVERECTSCHADHHQTARDCLACHPPARETHTRAVHLTGCAGSGCHTAVPATATVPARNICLACHREQADHKPGRDCATCHLSNWSIVARNE